jgi:regulator of sirC expression with transglutaminase-like and TPR domain
VSTWRDPGRTPAVVVHCVALALAAASGCRALYSPTAHLSPLPRSAGLVAGDLRDVLVLPDDEIDIGRAMLLAARDERAGLDVDGYLARLDELAARLRRRLPEGISAHEALRQLTQVVQPEGVPSRRTGNDRGGTGGLPAEIDISRLLDGARGNCLGISLLYLAVAERVGLPLYGVSAPEHFFVRFDDGVKRINIEPTMGGRIVADREYVAQRRISNEAVERGIYLRTESKRQVVASLLANRAGYRALAGMLPEALDDAERALAIKPYWPQAHVNRGLALELSGDVEGAEDAYHRALQLDPHCSGALNNLAAICTRRAVASASDESPGGLLESATKMIALALDLAPMRAEFHETAASVAAARGRLRSAARHLGRAAHLDPSNTRYREALVRIEDAIRNRQR